MLIARPYQAKDEAAIKELYAAQGFDYTAPDWNEMMLSTVIEEDGKILMAGFLRPTAEAYLLLNPHDATPKRIRLGQFLIVQKELSAAAQEAGIETVHCWIPPQVAPHFGKLLQHLGWTHPLWPCFAKEIT
jgi:hypothetical protein